MTQAVTEGEDGSPATAVPDAHYHFTGWDDGVSSATRTDTDVQADLNVTAQFALIPIPSPSKVWTVGGWRRKPGDNAEGPPRPPTPLPPGHLSPAGVWA